MNRSPDLTTEQVARAKILRDLPISRQATRRSWKQVAKDLGVARDAVMRHFEPEQYQRRLKWRGPVKQRQERREQGMGDVFAERDLALSAELDLTARLLGDPPPSRSALNRGTEDALPPWGSGSVRNRRVSLWLGDSSRSLAR